MIRRSILQRTSLKDCGVLNLIEIYNLFTPNLGGKTVNQYFFFLLINSSCSLLARITFLDVLSLFYKWLSFIKIYYSTFSLFFNVLRKRVMALLPLSPREIMLHLLHQTYSDYSMANCFFFISFIYEIKALKI
jgi:hypothetical protein